MSISNNNIHLRRIAATKEYHYQQPIHQEQPIPEDKISKNQSAGSSLKIIMSLLIFGFCCALLLVIFTRSSSSSSSNIINDDDNHHSIPQDASPPIKENSKQDLKKPATEGLEKNTHASDHPTKLSKSLNPKNTKDKEVVQKEKEADVASTIKPSSKNGKIKTTQEKKMNRIAPLFIAHGAPTLAIELDHAMNKFLGNKLSKQYKGQDAPKAVVVFTAHWEDSIANNGVAITFHDANTVYDTIYDFYGFPDEMYTIKYPAKGKLTELY